MLLSSVAKGDADIANDAGHRQAPTAAGGEQ
jgi:hypothetical protein